MSKNNGGPAFPGEFVEQRYVERSGGVCSKGYEDFTVKTPGMTMRDYFAAKAMQAMVMHDLHSLKGKQVPALAYEMADAMLDARDQ